MPSVKSKKTSKKSNTKTNTTTKSNLKNTNEKIENGKRILKVSAILASLGLGGYAFSKTKTGQEIKQKITNKLLEKFPKKLNK